MRKEKTHCKHGHPWHGDNIIHRKDGREACKACTYGWIKAYREARPCYYNRRWHQSKKPCPRCQAMIGPKAAHCGKCVGALAAAARTHCPAGHLFSTGNTVMRHARRADGKAYEVRKCRTCEREANRRAYIRKKEARAMAGFGK